MRFSQIIASSPDNTTAPLFNLSLSVPPYLRPVCRLHDVITDRKAVERTTRGERGLRAPAGWAVAARRLLAATIAAAAAPPRRSVERSAMDRWDESIYADDDVEEEVRHSGVVGALEFLLHFLSVAFVPSPVWDVSSAQTTRPCIRVGSRRQGAARPAAASRWSCAAPCTACIAMSSGRRSPPGILPVP